MIDSFPFAETRIRQLSATRQGRVSIGGFNYQAAYAIARLAAMHAKRSVLDLPDLPSGLRYDWAEDLDEVTTSQHFIFTQCKRVSDIGQPSQIARLLLGFAPKLLWTEELQRESLSFRLVCTDTRFGLGPKRISDHLATVEADVLAHGMAELQSAPHERSDRTLWQDLASQYGYRNLLKTLWERTEVLYVGEAALADHPAGPLLPAERSGLDLLLEENLLNPAKQREALGGLRRLIHSDLITFDPSSEQSIEGSGLSPRVIVPADVRSTLFAYQPPPKDKPPFIVVDRLYLEQQASKPRIPYVARPPDWADVVHGADPIIKFLEREDTEGVKSRVEQELLEPLRRGTDNRLGVLFVVGAPGAGKSTLVKRVAAQLIKEGKVLGVDLGVKGSPRDKVDCWWCYAAVGGTV